MQLTLIEGRTGVMLVTLAPERVPPGFIRRLVEAGIRVSLGHSAATYSETKAALAEGLTGFTHLFNAMRPLASREPGPIAAALETPDAWFGMIVDGHHVAPAMLRLALRGAARPMLVSDAMPPVGGRKAGFVLNGAEIAVRGGRCTRADGTLAGAAISMADAVRNCVRPARASAHRRPALRLHGAGGVPGTGRYARPHRPRLPRRPGGVRSEDHRGARDVGCGAA